MEVENEKINYWVIVRHEEDDNTSIVLLINQIDNNILNKNDIGGMSRSKPDAFEELCMSKWHTRVSSSDIIHVLMFQPDSIHNDE